MGLNLEKTVAGEYIEFTGPDFNENGYSNARYRRSTCSVKVEDVEFPARVEVLNMHGKWQQHPIVFIHYGTYDAHKKGRRSLVMILANGKYSIKAYNPQSSDRDIYAKAEKLGLTRGNRTSVRSIVREEE